jgi:hypothetical protein
MVLLGQTFEVSCLWEGEYCFGSFSLTWKLWKIISGNVGCKKIEIYKHEIWKIREKRAEETEMGKGLRKRMECE